MLKSAYLYICYSFSSQKIKRILATFSTSSYGCSPLLATNKKSREKTLLVAVAGWLRAWRVDDDGEKWGRRQEDDAGLPAAALSQGTWDCQPASKRARHRSSKNCRCAF
jgi:hypothetical protein